MKTSSWPEPVPGAPIDPRALADLHLAKQAAEVSNSARSFVPREGDRYDGTMFGDAVRFLRQAEDLVAATVVAERAHGASWDDLAGGADLAKSTVHQRWEPAEAAWQERLDRAENEALTAPLHPERKPWPILGQDPHALAADLDEWVARHTEPWDLERPAGSVTALVKRMDPLAEDLYLSRQRRRLLDQYMVPPPALEAPLAEREAVIDEALANQADSPRRAAELRASAEKNRRRAAHLRQQAAEGNAGTTWEQFAGPADTSTSAEES